MKTATIQTAENDSLLTAPVGRLLLKFAVPCVLAMLVSALYNIVDQIFIGWGVGYLGNAATNVVYPFTVIALALALLVGDGCAALLSLSLGRGDRETGGRCIGNGLAATIFLGLLLTVAGFVWEDPILRLFGVTDGCYAYAREYMTVILIGMPFYVFASAVNGAIRADGAPRYAMAATAVGAVLNLILDPVAIFGLHMGVRGAAIATVIGQTVSCLLSALYFRHTKLFRLTKASFRPNGRLFLRICQLGVTSLITQLSIVVIMTVANHLIGRLGPQSIYGADIPLSAVGIVMKVFAIVVAFVVGIAIGGQPIVGYNYGAGRYDRVMAVYRGILLANIAVGLLATVLFECFPGAIVHLFGSESALYNDYAEQCFRIYLGGILLFCVQRASSIFLMSIGRPVPATLLSICRDVVFFVPAIVLLALRFGVTGMLWSELVTDGLSFLLMLVFVGRELRRMRSRTAEQPLAVGERTAASEL